MQYFLTLLLLTTCWISNSQIATKELGLEIQTTNEIEKVVVSSLNPKLSFKQRSDVDKEVDTLSIQLKELGYIDLMTSTQKKNDSTYIAIFDLGQLYKTIKLSIESDKTLIAYIKDTGISIKNDSIEIETAFAKAYLKQLSSIASNNGNPFSKFQISQITKDENFLKGKLLHMPRQQRTVDRYVLKGYEDFPRSFLRYYARLKKGDSFNRDKLIKQNDLIDALPFASTEKEPEILFKQDSTIAYYYLKRNTVNRFDGFLGFSSGDESNFKLDGYLDLLLTNNLNYGESLALNYKADGNDQSQLKIQVNLPYLFNSPFGVESEIALFRKDSTFATSDLSANLYYTLSPTSSIGLGYTAVSSENLNEENTSLDDEIADYTTNGIKGLFNYSKIQNDYFSPNKGGVQLSLGYSTRTTNIESIEQIPLEINAEYLFQLNERNSIYTRNISKILFSDNYLTNELFRFGGIQTIRGFNENALFANTLSVLNTEYRYLLNQSLYVHSIIDGGYFENILQNQKTTLFSIGFGAGIRTQAGLLKINLANGKFEDLPFRFSNTKLHLILAIRF